MAHFHERLLAFSEDLFQQALARIEEERYIRANIAATASSSPLVFLILNRDTPPQIAQRARDLLDALQPILDEVRAALTTGYSERFLNGRRSPGNKDVEAFFSDLFDAARRAADAPLQ